MPKITFPDGQVKEFEKDISGKTIAESISNSLAKEAVAILVNGIQQDLCDLIKEDASISIITLKS